jgi:AcrR family transcriptional regulator
MPKRRSDAADADVADVADVAPPEARGREAVLAAVTRRYLKGERVDMSDVAQELGIGRATLYRWAGNHDDVLAEVLAEQTERLFRHTTIADGSGGADRVLGVVEAFMHAVLGSVPLKALTARDPLLFLRLATMPGAIEARAGHLLLEVLEQESAAGRLRLALPAPVLAQAIVRVADAFMYRHLLGAGPPDVRSALDVVALLLRGD